MQLNHYNTHFEQQKFPITLVCDNVTNAPNIGSLFRIADAFGVEKIILCGQNITLGRKMSKTSRATEKFVPYEVCENTATVIDDLKNKNYQIISVEITNKSTPIDSFHFSKNTPLAFVIGDENFGVSEDILKLSKHVIHINMFGQNSSMNVVQATNIVLYEATKQLSANK